MRVFVTGATGFIGSAVVGNLIGVGHQVLGLARSDAGASALVAAGAQVLRGDLEDTESLQRGAALSDGVIHTAFVQDTSKFKENCDIDRRAIEALGGALAGSDRPLIVTTGMSAPTEDHAAPSSANAPPRVSEQTALSTVARGVCAMVVRVPQVHDRDRQGVISDMIAVAREKGISAYVDEGLNRWPAVHRLDAAALYRCALERGVAGARYHAVAEGGIEVREIAQAIGRSMNVPVVSISREDAAGHFGWMAWFAGMDAPASSVLTQQRLGWSPTDQPGLIADMEGANVFGTAAA